MAISILPPYEVFIHVFSFWNPTPQELAKWAIVSKLFYEATKDRILWRDLITRDFPLYQMPTEVVSYKELYKQICEEYIEKAIRYQNAKVKIREESPICTSFMQPSVIFSKIKVVRLFTPEIITFFISKEKSLIQKVQAIKTHLNAIRSDAFESSLMEVLEDQESHENLQLLFKFGAKKRTVPRETSAISYSSFSFDFANFHKRSRVNALK